MAIAWDTTIAIPQPKKKKKKEKKKGKSCRICAFQQLTNRPFAARRPGSLGTTELGSHGCSSLLPWNWLFQS